MARPQAQIRGLGSVSITVGEIWRCENVRFHCDWYALPSIDSGMVTTATATIIDGGHSRNFERSLEARAMVPMVLVCVHELDTRSRVPFSTSYDQFHTYGTCVNMSISWSDIGTRAVTLQSKRSTAIATAATSMHAPHNPVRSSPRTQG